MGGDGGPSVIIDGLRRAAKGRDIRFLISGPQITLAPLVANSGLNIEMVNAASVVESDESVLDAGRKRDSSMYRAVEEVADGRAEAVISAGRTDVYALLSRRMLGFKDQSRRSMPYATYIPTERGRPCVVLDLGVKIDCSTQDLVRFAEQGDRYARVILGLKKPTIGLVNLAEEWGDCLETVRQAEIELGKNRELFYHGFIDNIIAGSVDVAVVDGFRGNVFLKALQGQAKWYAEVTRDSLKRSIGALFAAGGLRAMKQKLDPNLHNGAMFLGLKSIAVKSHGSANAVGIATAVSITLDRLIPNADRLI